MKTYFENWKDFNSMIEDFSHIRYEWDDPDGNYQRKDKPANLPAPESILFAAYTHYSYSGEASVFFEIDGDLFEVYGSHCSCAGLANQWNPRPVTWAALALRVSEIEEARIRYEADPDNGDWDLQSAPFGKFNPATQQAFMELVRSRLKS